MLDKKKSSTSPIKAMSMMANIGVTFLASVALGYGMGYYLDRWLQGLIHYSVPWLTMFFALMGIGAGFRGIFRLINEIHEDEDKE